MGFAPRLGWDIWLPRQRIYYSFSTCVLLVHLRILGEDTASEYGESITSLFCCKKLVGSVISSSAATGEYEVLYLERW